MDWLGQSQYMDRTVYWSSLSTAISEVHPDTIVVTLNSCNFHTHYKSFNDAITMAGCVLQACKSEDTCGILGTFYKQH